MLAILSIYFFYKRKYVASLLLNIFLSTQGFQLFLREDFVSPIYLAESYDYSMIATLFICIFQYKTILHICNLLPVARILLFYLFFIFIVFFYSLIVFEYKFIEALQTARFYLWPTYFFLFYMIPKSSLKNLTKILLRITFIISLLYLIQVTFNYPIISRDFELMGFNPNIEDLGIKRYLATPYFLFIFTAILFVEILKNKRISLGPVIGLLTFFSALILSYTRTTIFATLISLFTIAKNTLKTKIVIIFTLFFILLSLLILKNNEGLKARSEAAISEFPYLVELVNTDLSKADMRYLVNETSLTFRVGLFLERFQYLKEHPSNWLFGLGMIHEKSEPASRLNFKIGLTNSATGIAPQLDTGDSDWPGIMMRTGFVGIFFFLFMIKKMYSSLSKSKEIFSLSAKSAIVYFMVSSLSFVLFTSLNFMIQLMFIFALAHRFSSNNQ